MPVGTTVAVPRRARARRSVPDVEAPRRRRPRNRRRRRPSRRAAPVEAGLRAARRAAGRASSGGWPRAAGSRPRRSPAGSHASAGSTSRRSPDRPRGPDRRRGRRARRRRRPAARPCGCRARRPGAVERVALTSHPQDDRPPADRGVACSRLPDRDVRRHDTGEELRARLVDRHPDERPTVTDVLTKVCAVALMRHREVNALYAGDAIQLHPSANVGIAVADRPRAARPGHPRVPRP